MFEQDELMTLINVRKDDEIVIPLYIRIGNSNYYLDEIDTIEECSPSILKVGFGTYNTIFSKFKFPKASLINYSNSLLFKDYSEEKEYMVFESGYIDIEEIDNTTSQSNDINNMINNEINKWFNYIEKRIMNNVIKIRKRRIQQMLDENTYNLSSI